MSTPKICQPKRLTSQRYCMQVYSHPLLATPNLSTHHVRLRLLVSAEEDILSCPLPNAQVSCSRLAQYPELVQRCCSLDSLVIPTDPM